MSKPNRLGMLSQKSLVKAGYPLGCAISTIVALSTAIAVMLYGEILHGGPLANAVENLAGLLLGFVPYMLLTIGCLIYMLLTISCLIGESWTVTRSQRQLMEHLLESRSARLDTSGNVPVQAQLLVDDETVHPIPVPSTSL